MAQILQQSLPISVPESEDEAASSWSKDRLEAAAMQDTGCEEPDTSCRTHCCCQNPWSNDLPKVQPFLTRSTNLPYVESQRDGIIKIGVGTSCINP